LRRAACFRKSSAGVWSLESGICVEQGEATKHGWRSVPSATSNLTLALYLLRLQTPDSRLQTFPSLTPLVRRCYIATARRAQFLRLITQEVIIYGDVQWYRSSCRWSKDNRRRRGSQGSRSSHHSLHRRRRHG